jgi:hypothetical protein
MLLSTRQHGTVRSLPAFFSSLDYSMAVNFSQSSSSSSPPIDAFSRILIITASFFAVAALALIIVGTVTTSWYYTEDANGNTQNYNLFTYCSGTKLNGSSTCVDMPRQTALGIGTLNAAAVLVVGICLLGCGMLVTIAMNFVQLTGILLFIAPIVLFLASIFILVTFVLGSQVTLFNSYSAILVQTAHAATIFSAVIIAFASGRLHVRYYQQF